MSESDRRFIRRYLIPFAYLGKGCACRKRKVNELQTKSQTSKENGQMNGNDWVTEVSTLEDEELSWKRLSVIMDKVFFNIYIFLIIASTLILFVLIIIGYLTNR